MRFKILLFLLIGTFCLTSVAVCSDCRDTTDMCCLDGWVCDTYYRNPYTAIVEDKWVQEETKAELEANFKKTCGYKCNQNTRAKYCKDDDPDIEYHAHCFVGKFKDHITEETTGPTVVRAERRCFRSDEENYNGNICRQPFCHEGDVHVGICEDGYCVFQEMQDCSPVDDCLLAAGCVSVGLHGARCIYDLRSCGSTSYCSYELNDCVPFTRQYCRDEDDCQDLNCFGEKCEDTIPSLEGQKECNYEYKPCDEDGEVCYMDNEECVLDYFSFERYNPVGELKTCRVESDENFTETEDYIYFKNLPSHDKLGIPIASFEIYAGKSTHDSGYWVKIASVGYNAQKEDYIIKVDPVKQMVLPEECGLDSEFFYYPDAYMVHFLNNEGGISLNKAGIVHKKDEKCPEGLF